jgi:hypothetical protein
MPAKPINDQYRSPLASPSLYQHHAQQSALQNNGSPMPNSPIGPSLSQQQQQQQQSVIAMYGSPPSLPPKPPLPSHNTLVGGNAGGGSMELFDPSKVPANKRPSFGTAPPILTNRQSFGNGSGGNNVHMGMTGGFPRAEGQGQGPSSQQQ